MIVLLENRIKLYKTISEENVFAKELLFNEIQKKVYEKEQVTRFLERPNSIINSLKQLLLEIDQKNKNKF